MTSFRSPNAENPGVAWVQTSATPGLVGEVGHVASPAIFKIAYVDRRITGSTPVLTAPNKSRE